MDRRHFLKATTTPLRAALGAGTTTVAALSAMPITIARVASAATVGGPFSGVSHNVCDTLESGTRTGLCDGVEMAGTPVVRGDDTILFISEGGDTIIAAAQPRTVLVPFVRYGFDWSVPGDPEATVDDEARHIDGAIGNRVVCLFDAAVIAVHTNNDLKATYETAVSALAERLPDIEYLLVNDREAEKFLPHAGNHVVIASKFVPQQMIYATAHPAKTGALYRHPDGRIAMFIRHSSVARAFIQS